jgi:hypothetical protein
MEEQTKYHTVLKISKDDIFCSIMDFYHENTAIKDDEIIDKVSPMYNIFSEDDVAAVAEKLGKRLLFNEFLGRLFYSEIGVIAKELIKQRAQ